MAQITIESGVAPELSRLVYESCSDSDDEMVTETTSGVQQSEDLEDDEAGAVRLSKPKSGRVWKNKRVTRFSAIKRNPTFNTNWSKKVEQRQGMKVVKELQREVTERKILDKQDKARRRKEQEERKKANALKAEVVQVIKNTKKLKRLKKKQLRKIEKRDTLPIVQPSTAASTV